MTFDKEEWEKRKEEEKVAWDDNVLPPDPSLQDELKHKLRNNEILVNFNGHFAQKEGPITLGESTFDTEHSWEWIYDKLLPSMAELFMAHLYDSEATLPTIMKTETCGECGERVDIWWTGEMFEIKPHNRQRKYVADNSPCSESGGIKDYSVEIDVPSGRLVFANDFRRFVPEADKDRYVNYNSEIKLTVQDYAESNMFHAFVGNSCPSVYVDMFDIINVGNMFDPDEEMGMENFDLGKHKGSICTDLWWFSATDYEYLKKRGAEQDIDDDAIDDWIEVSIDVEPGRYRMKVYATPAADGKSWRSGERFVSIARM
jgi:hypothetical protein